MNWAKLRQQTTSSLSIEELRSLCFDLEIDYENLPGEGKEAKVREMIALMQRDNKIPSLIDHLSEIRPNIQWVEIYLDEPPKETFKATDLDQEDEGVLDFAITIVEAGDKLVVLMEAAGEAANILSDKIEANTKKLRLTASNDFYKAHAIATGIALDHENFAGEIDRIATETVGLWKSFRDAYHPFFVLKSDDLKRWLSISNNPETYVNRVISAKTTFDSVSNKIQNLRQNIESARLSLIQLRGLSRKLNEAVSKTDKALVKYVDVLDKIKEDLDHLSDLAKQLPSLIDDLRK